MMDDLFLEAVLSEFCLLLPRVRRMHQDDTVCRGCANHINKYQEQKTVMFLEVQFIYQKNRDLVQIETSNT